MEQTTDLNKSNEGPQNFLTHAVRAGKNGTISVTSCHVCKSKIRPQIETMFDQKMSLSSIRNFCEENKEALTLAQLRHHLDSHYSNMAHQCAIAEYRDNLDKMLAQRQNMVDDMLTSINISKLELANISALYVPINDLDKLEKKERIVTMLQKSIKEGYEFIKSLHDSETKAKATEERFVKVWTLKLDQAKTPEERDLIIATLKDFQTNLKELGE